MKNRLRILRDSGVDAFRDYLRILRQDPVAPPPTDILTRKSTSQPIDQEIFLDAIVPGNHYEMAGRLLDKLAPVPDICRPDNAGMWSWLSLYYFDLVCPAGKKGTRFPGKDYRHIPESTFQTAHRHLLSGPFHLVHRYGERVRFLLFNPVNKESRLYHQLCGRQTFVSNPAIMELAGLLYSNPKTGGPKPGAASLTEPGAGFRFITIIQQLELTYDLFSMPAEQIRLLLPKEFDPWLPKAKPKTKNQKNDR